MQIYSTTFPVTDALTKDIFIDLVIEWNQGSPYNKINNLNWDRKNRNVKFEEGNLSLWIEEIRAYNTIAIRFHQLDENNIIWTTDVVVNFDKKIFTIKLDRETTVDTVGFKPKFKAPVIVKMLLERGYAGLDSGLEISAQPLAISKENYKIIESAINRNVSYSMPIIYVTKSWGKYPFKVDELAYRLRGVAHVLMEEDMEVTKILRDTCNGKNSHHGSVGIYYPGVTEDKIIATSKYEGREDILIDQIVTMVCQYVNQQARDRMMTWEGVQNELLRLKYVTATEKKTQAEHEVAQTYDIFNGELKEKEKYIEELNNRITALQAENQGLHAKYDQVTEAPLLFYGLEKDLYEGEIRSQILEMLKDHLKHVQKKSRKEDIILDILENNEQEIKISDQKDKIKKILKGYTKVNDNLKRELQEFGFEIKKDGGHYKIIYKKDPRYMFTMSASGSDSQHGGGNLSSEIINKIF